MKQFFYILLIFGLIYFSYWYITKIPHVVSVSGTLNIWEEKTPENFYTASINGAATNTGDNPAKDIWVIYKIGNDEVTAYIDELQPKQSLKFRTGTSRSAIKNPEIKLVSVKYSE